MTSTYIGQEFCLVWLALIDMEMIFRGLLKQIAANISSIFIDIQDKNKFNDINYTEIKEEWTT